MISKKAEFDVPPPGLGLKTVIVAAPAVAMSEASTAAVSRDLLTKVVARARPFHFTAEPATNPVPFTTSVNPAAPGRLASGTSGKLIKGTGLPVLASSLWPGCSCADSKAGIANVVSNSVAIVTAVCWVFILLPMLRVDYGFADARLRIVVRKRKMLQHCPTKRA
jgi:hypothetical protein